MDGLRELILQDTEERHCSVLERFCEVAYRLALPPRLSSVNPAFHVSMLRKYYEDPSHVGFQLGAVDKDLTYDEELIAIFDRQVRKLSSKNIASVKVQLRGQAIKDATRETEHDMRRRYSHLFL
ncbi:PREDICTED: uncharacterized protein LOC109220266 [Nicotiana attenuata]|uniref:uncharacterized protein LOC109214722 n=1 Tax=Nicotiana attenuata TaxID=49451 RepID=UPI0009046521|nr:PREDICTED: uncharacterized protein LOC109214722 [Nicotiana attenuata]XP_019240267.1 PREDICTED: uncharacterized protein LOC109220266 [Nicotiana attenuata]